MFKIRQWAVLLWATFFMFACTTSAEAQVRLIKQSSTTSPVFFLLVDSGSLSIGQTGKASGGGALVITVKREGGAAATGTGTTAEVDATNFPGIYSYTSTSATETGTVGMVLYHVTCTGCGVVDFKAQVVAFDPGDAAGLGLSRLDVVVSTRASSSVLGTPAGASIAADIAGLPTNASIASAVFATAVPGAFMAGSFGYKFGNSLDGSGFAKANLQTWLGSAPNSLASGLVPVRVDAYANGQDPFTLVMSSGTVLNIPGTGTTNGSSMTLNKLQLENLIAAISAGGSIPTGGPIVSGSQQISYYLVGKPKTSQYLVATGTVTYDSARVQTGRTFLIANPFPTVP